MACQLWVSRALSLVPQSLALAAATTRKVAGIEMFHNGAIVYAALIVSFQKNGSWSHELAMPALSSEFAQELNKIYLRPLVYLETR